MDVVGGSAAGVLSSRAGEPADGLYGHVTVAEDLAGEAEAFGVDEASGGEEVLFGPGHGVRFAGDELDSAGGAAGVAAAGVELVDGGFVGEGVDEALVVGDVEGADFFYRELGHGRHLRGFARGEERRMLWA